MNTLASTAQVSAESTIRKMVSGDGSELGLGDMAGIFFLVEFLTVIKR